MADRAAIILAAGQGTRMQSKLPKVLHPVGGRAMLDWLIALAEDLGCQRIIVVASPGTPEVQAHVRDTLGDQALVLQETALGTGHAVRCAETALAGFKGDVVVLYGDTPLIPSSVVEALFEQISSTSELGVLGFNAADPGAYGRLVTGSDGMLQAIVEAKEASADELAISFCNSGVMAAKAGLLFELLAAVTNDNVKGEYYLTDTVGLARARGAACCAVNCEETDVLGVNSRVELAQAEAAFQQRRREQAIRDGVTMIAPETVFFSYDTEIQTDTFIEPNVVFGTGVRIASNVRIGAFSHIQQAVISEDCEIGPFARLRPGSVMSAGAKIGNFVEMKNTQLGPGAKANHLAYLGDSEIGAESNIGAGTIFCNYDGFRKHRTIVGAGAFVGSNSSLVAPVRIGDGAMIGSGSVVTQDVEPNALALGRAQQTVKSGWASRFRDAMTAIKTARSKR
ncbi:MAG: UDP-N-acetylglucosamine diphosphorylase/glucosamine-1-phosphate N-acetyltransferase [Hyphomonas sp. TMED17]|nr:MAG: UDP-N-acetylglucosamine diphosphorylase/glucosamine-1-phosphate N-acetyltransferase [Hyphomonas sp. TMED17]